MKMIFVAMMVALAVPLATVSGADASTAGGLDRTFSGNGLATLKSSYGSGMGIAGTTDGKVVQALSRDRVARFTHRGKPDRGFGGDGIVRTAIGGAVIHPVDVLVDRKNRILVGGSCTRCGPHRTRGVAIGRFLPNGRPDRSFAADGLAVRDIGKYSALHELAFAPGGKIVAVGDTGSRGFLWGLRADGDADRSISRSGMLRMDAAFKAVNSVAVGKQGKITIGGRYAQPGLGKVMGVARFLPNGRRDRTFAGDGVAAFRTENARSGTVQDLTIDRRGRVVGVGSDRSLNAVVFRLTNRGSLDKSFSGDGNATIGYTDAHSVSVDRKGRILMLGNVQTGEGTWSTASILRLDGDKGKSFKFKSRMAGIRDHFVDGKGRIVASGYTRKDPAVVRVLNP